MMFIDDRLHVILGFRVGQTKQGNDYLEAEAAGTAYEGYEDELMAKYVLTPRLGVMYKLKLTLTYKIN
jgi:hypothetical protein